MVFENIKNLSLDELIAMLHSSIVSFGRGVDDLNKSNNEIALDEINELREHVRRRFGDTEERADIERLSKLVRLFKEDRRALELVREDVDSWLELLDAIKLHIGSGEKSKEERKDVERLTKELTALQASLRRR
jgi:cobalamin-dependent methionine synthase I